MAIAADLELTPKDLPRVAPSEPDNALNTFQVKPGFRLDLAAAEPLVADPIALAFDEDGRLFVVEMRDYSERRHERLGRIRLLEDTDADGKFDRSSIYADDLPWPTALICYDGGVFVGSTPDILFVKDTNGDRKADIREVVFTGFGAGIERLNVQQLINSFVWGLDNRIHGATGGNGGRITSPKHSGKPAVDLRGRNFSFDPRTFELRPETGGGQYGMAFDDRGRKFVCSNSAHLQMILLEDRYAGLNPHISIPSPLVNIAEDGPAAPVYRISPDEPWRVIRTKWRVDGKVSGPIEGGGRPSGYFTAATGITIYRGNAWPDSFRGNAIVADCGSNLIHRKQLFPNGVAMTGRRPTQGTNEFVASTDNWFRPVQLVNAPDGCIYAADMYRETIEHPWSLPEPLKKHLDLNSGNDRGRIYRIAPADFSPSPSPALSRASTEQLVRTLEHSNGWHRDTAARLIYERGDRTAIPLLRELAVSGSTPESRFHSLYALDGLSGLDAQGVRQALKDSDAAVREHAVRLAERIRHADTLAEPLFELAGDQDPRVRYQLALTIGKLQLPNRSDALLRIIRSSVDDAWVRAAVLNACVGESIGMLNALTASIPDLNQLCASDAGREFVEQLCRTVAAESTPAQFSDAISKLEKIDARDLRFLLASALLGETTGQPAGPRGDAKARRTVDRIVNQALGAASDTTVPERERISAVSLLSNVPWNKTKPILSNLLDARNSPALQNAAVSTLARSNHADAGATLVSAWPQLTPPARGQALSILLGRKERAAVLIQALENGSVRPSELSPAQWQQLRRQTDGELRSRVDRLLNANQVASRSETIEKYRAALDLDPDAGRGARIYNERCASCHLLDGSRGYAVGPDLASVRSNGKEKILISILDPNREVNPAYLSYSVQTENGDSWTGIIADDNASAVRVRQAFGLDQAVRREEIQQIRNMGVSMMPEGLEAGLSVQDMADLLEFILQ